jgi:acyl-CoA reductase-like NAD-dependent aldehyde dehydrogenase
MNDLQLPDTSRLYIDGSWVVPHGSERLLVFDPFTERPLCELHAADNDDVSRAVLSAARAQPQWEATALAERVRLCRAIADALESRADYLADLMTADLGMPRRQSRATQIDLAVTDLRNLADAAADFDFDYALGRTRVRERGVGVVAAITPWNFPLHQIIAKVGGALLAGCSVVLKPSEVVPLVAYALADAIHGEGIPPGVFNLIAGRGPAIGQALVSHPLVDMVSFTGSATAGADVAATAGARLRRTTLELGGKSPAVILPDIGTSDLARVVKSAAARGFFNSGQACNALTRILVPSHHLHLTEEIIEDYARTRTLGDPRHQQTQLGPLASAPQRVRVHGYIASGIQDGARLIVGGAEAPDQLDTGYFVRPTVFSEVKREMSIVREEIFGPVLVLQSYDTVEQAVELANDTPFGLAAGVWSADVDEAAIFATRIRAGQIEINGAAYDSMAPFGGFGDSGYGREFGVSGLREFVAPQAIVG